MSAVTEVTAKGFPLFKRRMLVVTKFKSNNDVVGYVGMHRSKFVAAKAAQETWLGIKSKIWQKK